MLKVKRGLADKVEVFDPKVSIQKYQNMLDLLDICAAGGEANETGFLR
jgi:hypothetical protein